MPYGDNCSPPTGRTDPIGNLWCAIGEQTREPHLSRRVQRGRAPYGSGERAVVMALLQSRPPFLTQGQRSQTETTSEAGDATPPPGPLCPPSSGLPLYARTAGLPAASSSPSRRVISGSS
jgi:hypothetical protein